MNRPTGEVEELLALADEAMADGSFTEAVGILRQAANVAPLRRDIRQKLAAALAGAPPAAPPPVRKRRQLTVQTPAPQPAPVTDFDLEDLERAHEIALDTEEYVEEYADDAGEELRFPAAEKRSAPSHSARERFEVPVYDDGPDDNSDHLAEVARKAFKAAAGTTARASVATRHLTNLLNSGIQSWKSSLMEQIQSQKAASAAQQPVRASADTVGDATEAGLFTPRQELETYITRPVSAAPVAFSAPAADDLDLAEAAAEEETEADATDRMVRPRSREVSQKAASSSTGKGRSRSRRQTDVEDVLAAGFGSFFEAIARVEKKKFVYASVYMIMAGLVALACYDISRKFPEVRAITPASAVQSASLGELDLSSESFGNPIEEAQRLAKQGNRTQAIELLRTKLAAGVSSVGVDKLKIELASQLNAEAEENLRNNNLPQSAALYRQAVELLPGDSNLSLRLANALYYQAIMSQANTAEKAKTLGEARQILESLVGRGTDNVQAYRLMALLHEAEGQKNSARASWQKVKSLAAENSAEQREAISHLK